MLIDTYHRNFCEGLVVSVDTGTLVFVEHRLPALVLVIQYCITEKGNTVAVTVYHFRHYYYFLIILYCVDIFYVISTFKVFEPVSKYM